MIDARLVSRYRPPMLAWVFALTLIACRPPAPEGYYDHCDPTGADTALGECEEGLLCVDFGPGGSCTTACATDSDCPATGNGRPTRCVDDLCREDEPTD